MTDPTIEVRRSTERFTTTTDWLESRHSFSFGPHYDPTNVGHALLVAHNEDIVAPGTGYDTHPHRDIEIVTWVLDGSLVHEDSSGRTGTITPGLVQRMSAGSGIAHSERNDAPAGGESAHFVQMWVQPISTGLTPSYAQHEVGDVAGSGLVALASGRSDALISVHADATLHVARLTGPWVQLPDAPYVHLFVARGAVELEGTGTLSTGDAARFTAGGARVSGTGEILVWEMHALSP